MLDVGITAGDVDLVWASSSVDTGNGNTGFTMKGKGPLLGINVTDKFGNGQLVSARGGWFRSRLVAGISGLGSASFQGAGSYALTPNVGLGASHDNYHGRANVDGIKTGASVAVVSGFGEYRF